MNLLLIAQKIWRYRLATVPILVFVLMGAFYVVVIKGPVYEATSSYILVNPPPPPTDEQIARDPSLAEIDADNPYTRYSDQSVVVQVLSAQLSSESAQSDLAKQGADPRYTVAASAKFGLTAPIVEITGTGSSPEAAVATATVVGAAVKHELNRMQDERGVASDYRITTEPVVLPQDARLKASGQLRTLIGIFALGCVLLFVVVSVADALNELRTGRRRGRTGDLAGGVPLEPIPTHGRDYKHSLVGAQPNAAPADADSQPGTASNGDAGGHPRPAIPPGAGGWSDPEREWAAIRAETGARRHPPPGSRPPGS